MECKVLTYKLIKRNINWIIKPTVLNQLKVSKSSQEAKMDVLKKLERVKKELESLHDNL